MDFSRGFCRVPSPFLPGRFIRHYRSPVPDLLFEDVRATRLEEIRPYLNNLAGVTTRTRLNRVTVFLTYRCNLDCPYCKTIARSRQELGLFSRKGISFTRQSFKEFLLSLEDTPISHLHFTGGEAALIRDLPSMGRVAKERGVEHLSITSNGTLSKQIYLALVESGMDEIRISLDAHAAELGATLTRRKRAWSAAVETITTLAARRDARQPFFLIANTVVSSANHEHVVETVRLLLSLGVDDIKLILAVQEKERFGDWGLASALTEIENILKTYPAWAFPLLRRKLSTVFIQNGIGLSDVAMPVRKDWCCYIPLTERTVDGVYYYPCSVYVREGGAPLGRLNESAAEQREKTVAFVTKGDCLTDPICRQYCLYCTKVFNIAANEARGHDKTSAGSGDPFSAPTLARGTGTGSPADTLTPNCLVEL